MTKSKIVLWMVFGYLMGSCECGVNKPLPSYSRAYIFYKNFKGEDLLDVNTAGHFDFSIIKIDGKSGITNGKVLAGTGFTHIGFPEGYYLELPLLTTDAYHIISLNSTNSDTLSYTYTGTKLMQCDYNKINVLPANAAVQFPIIIVK
jgi:hypothetical protein